MIALIQWVASTPRQALTSDNHRSNLEKRLKLASCHSDYFLSDKRNRGTISRAPVVYTSTGKLHSDKRRYYIIKLLELVCTVHPRLVGIYQVYTS